MQICRCIKEPKAKSYGFEIGQPYYCKKQKKAWTVNTDMDFQYPYLFEVDRFEQHFKEVS